jgi:glyoxylase I family protein
MIFEGLCPLFQVFDLPTSLRFYEQLGFLILQQSPGWAWLRCGTAELMLNTAYDPDAERPPHPDDARIAAHEDTCLYIGCPDVDAAYGELSKLIPSLKPPQIAPYGMKQLYLRDPDGYSLCFQWKP